MGCLIHPKTHIKIFWANLLGLRSPPPPILRHLIHARYLEKGEQQKQQQLLGNEEVQPPADKEAAEPNTEAPVGDFSQQGLSEVRFSTQVLLLVSLCPAFLG